MPQSKQDMPPLHLDFNKPDDARRFLKGMRNPTGARVTFACLADGSRVEFDTASDEQAMQMASQLYEMLYEPQDSEWYFEEEMVH